MISDYESNMNVIAVVTIDGAVASSGTLVARVGTSIRGVATASTVALPMGSYAGEFPFFITVYGNSDGESLTFELDQSGTRTSLTASESVMFTGDGSYGSVTAPLVLSSGFASPPPPSTPPVSALLRLPRARTPLHAPIPIHVHRPHDVVRVCCRASRRFQLCA